MSILKVVEPATGLVFFDLVDSLPTAINSEKVGPEQDTMIGKGSSLSSDGMRVKKQYLG